MRLFRMTTVTAGKPWTSRVWYGEIRDHNRKLRRLALFTDRSLSWSYLERCKALIECRRAGFDPSPELKAWLSGLPSPSLDKLIHFGFLSPSVVQTDLPLSQHIEDYVQALEARGRNARHIAGAKAILEATASGLKARTLADMTTERVYAYLADRRKHGSRRLTCTTCNHYIKTLRAWARWLVASQRIPADPFIGLSRLDTAGDRKRQRRPLTVDELDRLVRTAAAGHYHWCMTGPHRALLYRLAASTGLRAGALRSLRRRDFDLNGQPPTVQVASKRKIHRLPLRADLLPDLLALLKRRTPAEAVFTMPARANVCRMFRADLAAAGISVRDQAGRILDFHSLRRTFATELYRAGVRPALAQRLMGHSTVDLTTNLYTDIGLEDELRAVESLGASDIKRTRRDIRRKVSGAKTRKRTPTHKRTAVPKRRKS